MVEFHSNKKAAEGGTIAGVQLPGVPPASEKDHPTLLGSSAPAPNSLYVAYSSAGANSLAATVALFCSVPATAPGFTDELNIAGATKIVSRIAAG
jgi:hypothetical protein